VENENGPKKLTFFSKKPIECPVCGGSFFREELFSGGGRLIAGNLTTELRRLYEPSKKYGESFPLIYSVLVCPFCFYSVFHQDFAELPENSKQQLKDSTDKRIASIRPIFDNLDFSEPRTLNEGAASYYFAMMCYDAFPADYSPTFKRGLSALRCAWTFSDLHRKKPGDNFDYLAKILYHKARFFYTLSVEKETSGEESLGAAKSLGPDIDKNYGYDGVLYLYGLLEFYYGPKSDPELRKKSLENAKRTVAKIFGMGRASKNKPASILDSSRDLFNDINRELGVEGDE
jgi:uncharacterized protein